MAIEYWGIRVPDSLAERVDPATTALVVVDLQNDFVHPHGHCAKSVPIDGFRAVLPANARLIAAARAVGIGVYYTAQVQRPDGAYASAVWIADNLRYGPSFEPMHCMEGTWGAEIADEVAPAPGEVVVRKFPRGGFRGTNLAPMLRSRGVATVVVSGVAATGCVESTTRDALESDHELDGRAEGVHRRARQQRRLHGLEDGDRRSRQGLCSISRTSQHPRQRRRPLRGRHRHGHRQHGDDGRHQRLAAHLDLDVERAPGRSARAA
jgi:nicotinamidase-related amidase